MVTATRFATLEFTYVIYVNAQCVKLQILDAGERPVFTAQWRCGKTGLEIPDDVMSGLNLALRYYNIDVSLCRDLVHSAIGMHEIGDYYALSGISVDSFERQARND